MISLANYMTTIRRVTFLTTLVFSFIVLSLSAALVSLTGQALSLSFSGLPLATSLLTLLAVGPMFFVDWYRKGSYFSYVVVEVSCLSLLWILWLSSAASTAQKDQVISQVFSGQSGCSWSSYTSTISPYPYGQNPANYGYPSGLNHACHEIKAIMAFSFLTWLLLMFYTVTLLVLALRARSRGHNVWQSAVSDGTLFYPSDPSEKVGSGAPQAVATQPAVYQSYPPLAQQYISPPAQQYIPGGGSPPAQQYLPISVSHAYPAQA